MNTDKIFNSEFVLSSYLLHEKKETTSLLMNLGFFKPLFLNNASDLLSKVLKNKNQILDNELLKKYPILTKHLIDHRILIPKNQKEEDNFNKRVYKKDGKSYSISVYLFVTQNCNLACVYCLAGKNYKKNVIMTEEIAFKSINFISNLVQTNGEIEIIFFGGEPLLNWKLIKKCILYVEQTVSKRYKDIRYRYHITTNLTLLPDDFISFVKAKNISVLTDIDGLQHDHDRLRPTLSGKGSFNTIINNVYKLIESDIPIEIRTTVTSVNENNLLEICSTLMDIGVESCAFPLLIPVDSDQKLVDKCLYPNYEIYVSQIKSIIKNKIISPQKLHPVSEFVNFFSNGKITESGCGMPRGSTCIVDSEGNIYPCIYLAGNESFRLSNVRDALKNSAIFFNNAFFSKYKNKFGIDKGSCKKCIYKFACGGGCPIISLSIDTNTKEGQYAEKSFRSAWCAIVKASIKILAWHIGKESNSKSAFSF